MLFAIKYYGMDMYNLRFLIQKEITLNQFNILYKPNLSKKVD